MYNGSKVNSNSPRPDIYIGKSSPASIAMSDSRSFGPVLGKNVTQSCAGPLPPKSTYIKKRLPLQTLALSSDGNYSSVRAKLIGKGYGHRRSKAPWLTSRLMSVYSPIARSKPYKKITSNHSRPSVKSTVSGELLGLGSQDEHGKKLHSTPIRKIHARSFGTDTKAKKTLSWMSLEETSTSPIYSDGLTDTPLSWKTKEEASPCPQRGSGSPQTLTRGLGFLHLTKTRPMRCYEDCQ